MKRFLSALFHALLFVGICWLFAWILAGGVEGW